jgi:hypothetical protein
MKVDDEELNVPDDILKDASAARYQMLSKNHSSERIGKIYKWAKTCE